MPLVQINACADQPAPAGGGDLHTVLTRAMAQGPGPVTILIHGFRFSPFRPDRNPHAHILSLTPLPRDRRARSWPRHLGFDGTRTDEGLCIGFGWQATGHIWGAYARAAQAGQALARLLDMIADLRPDAPVGVLAHSLGARVALSALPRMARPMPMRAILMAPAELTSRTRAALDSPAGHAGDFLNVASRENDIYDAALEGLVAPHRPADRALGLGTVARPNWLTLQIDHADTLSALAGLGHPVAPPARRVCHWSPYLRPGMFDLYRAILSGALPMDRLRATLPGTASPRWSRLLAPPRITAPLPFAGKASS